MCADLIMLWWGIFCLAEILKSCDLVTSLQPLYRPDWMFPSLNSARKVGFICCYMYAAVHTGVLLIFINSVMGHTLAGMKVTAGHRPKPVHIYSYIGRPFHSAIDHYGRTRDGHATKLSPHAKKMLSHQKFNGYKCSQAKDSCGD